MRLDSIKLHNYRNFSDYYLELGHKTTVLIGKNGMGKTNLIAAMVQVLSFIFSKQRDKKQYDFIASSDRKVQGFSGTDARFENVDYQYPIKIHAEGTLSEVDTPGADLLGGSLGWSFEQESATSGLKDSLFRDAYLKFWQYYNERNEKPVLAYFSDGFPHKNTRISNAIKSKLESGNPLPPNTGYYQWDLDQSCVEIWKTYFAMQWNNNSTKPDEAKGRYVNAVTQVLKQFTLPLESGVNESLAITDLYSEFRGGKLVMMIEYDNGTKKPFDSLPQGYNRIFSMVFDLANRSYLLNGHCNPEGIVLIDEIELHLHPTVAMEILPRLQRAFPRLQFIVSTHSPLVITNFDQTNGDSEDHKLYKLYSKDGLYYNRLIEDVFGIDYNSGLTDVMDTPHSNVQMEELRKMYLYWKEKDAVKAEKIADKLRNEYAHNISFIKTLGL